MNQELKKTHGLYHYYEGRIKLGPNVNMYGVCKWLFGDCTELRGNGTGIHGDCTGISGNFDDCDLSDSNRDVGVGIWDLVKKY